MKKVYPLFILFLAAQWSIGQSNLPSSIANEKKAVIQSLEAKKQQYVDVATNIWNLAELGYKEGKSANLLQSMLKEEGFTIETGVAGIPTAFTATFGSGSPVIGVLGEYDALPGFSQDAVPFKKELAGNTNGHACGHHLFGSASAAAAIAVKNWLKTTGRKGTIRFYGTPAEEGGAGKVYMVRAGLFQDVDAVIHWHPGDDNNANPISSLSNKSAKFRFRGIASHAAASPERGRSALDAVEALNYMVNMMREHIPEKSRVHYVITRGGEAPNVVPAFAEVYYYIRHPEMDVVKDLFNRVTKAAEGAALGTGTTMDYEVIHGVYNLLPNQILSTNLYENLKTVGGVNYDKTEEDFALKIFPSLNRKDVNISDAALVKPYADQSDEAFGSTDVGDISWLVPTAGISSATWVPGTAAHSWQAVAAGGMSIGHKGMMVAAKTMALTIMDCLVSPEMLKNAKLELLKRRGGDQFKYEALLGDRNPPLDYRN
ncbi:MAG: amidohydrolase [Saprospiraceae bacterium]|jgi:aminobenzoyl-glutamate utilization protein B|nr:amidohydrolase [Saprospiraceae bacterium]